MTTNFFFEETSELTMFLSPNAFLLVDLCIYSWIWDVAYEFVLFIFKFSLREWKRCLKWNFIFTFVFFYGVLFGKEKGKR